ncbi:MAG TPA: DeoR/GlpR family DNA-binding transcription regulator [Bryobacteraceae bacterium]|jgi:DeoR family transcriptional regulator of aga operon|nr:DeoR/GlpR family DNA-binding transcription regulator [Bryobacteraceae bacterium]
MRPLEKKVKARNTSRAAPTPRFTLLADERRREILLLLRKDGRVSVEDLVRRFQVSAVTLRADLGQLASQGVLERSYGGALLPQEGAEDFPLSVKSSIHHAEKVRIGRAAARLIKADQTIILDSGTTSLEVARALKRSATKPLTIITHALNVAQELTSVPSVSVIMIGGLMRHVSGSFVGPQAERAIRELHAHHLFLGVDGLDPETGLSTPDLLEAQLNALMLQVADETTVIADSSKLGRRSLSIIAPVRTVQRLITDRQAPENILSSISRLGVLVHTV